MRLLESMLAPWKPGVYHGLRQGAPYFEGWYFKLVNPAGDRRMAIIPGVFKHENPADSHAFVQVLDGVTGSAVYHRYPVDEFHASGRMFDVRIGAKYDLQDAADAHRALEARATTGKVLLVP